MSESDEERAQREHAAALMGRVMEVARVAARFRAGREMVASDPSEALRAARAQRNELLISRIATAMASVGFHWGRRDRGR